MLEINALIIYNIYKWYTRCIRCFLKYVEAPLSESEKDFEDEFVKRLQKTVKEVKVSREMGARYMTFQELLNDERAAGREEGREEGRAEGRAEERVNTEREARRADEAEKRVRRLEKELALLQKNS